MNAPVVVPLDGSGFAEAALPMAGLLAALTGAELHLVHVTAPATADPFHPDARLSVEAHVRNATVHYLEARARELSQRNGPTTHTAVVDDGGGIARAIAEYAESVEADWIVLTTHGTGGFRGWITGSVAQQLAKVATTRLVFVRSWDTTVNLAPGERRIGRILVAVDGTPESECALRPAAELARTFGAPLALVRVVPPRALGGGLAGRLPGGAPTAIEAEAAAYLEQLTEEMRTAQVRAEPWAVASATAAGGILQAAVESGADMLVMATHGRRGLERMVLGSVASEVLRESTLPVVLVPPALGAPIDGAAPAVAVTPAAGGASRPGAPAR